MEKTLANFSVPKEPPLVGLKATFTRAWYLLLSNIAQAPGVTRILEGRGDPNGVYQGNMGQMFLNRDGGALSTLWVKEVGDGDKFGWVGK